MILAAILLQGAPVLTPHLVEPETAGTGAEPGSKANIEAVQEGEPEESEWTRTADIGIIDESGNTESLNSFANLLLKWEDSDQIWDLTGQYRATRDTDQTTGENYSDRRLIVLASSYHHFLSDEKHAFGYGKAARREDKPNDLLRRFDAGIGAGYRWDLYTDAYASVEAGWSWVEDLKAGLEDVETGALRVAYDVDTPLAKHVSLINEGESLEGSGLRTYNHVTSFKWTLNRANGTEVYLQASYQVFYDGNPVPSDTSTDRIFSVTLGADF